MRQQIYWLGEYRGVHYRIIKEHMQDTEQPIWWWAEVILYSEQVPEEHRSYLFPLGVQQLSPSGNPFTHFTFPVIEHWMDTFIVECTYSANSRPVAYFGWDYQHYNWNLEGVNQLSIERECHEVIDYFHRIYHILTRCDYCGKMGDPEKENWINPGFGKWQPIHSECNEARLKWSQEHGFSDAEYGLDGYGNKLEENVENT